MAAPVAKADFAAIFAAVKIRPRARARKSALLTQPYLDKAEIHLGKQSVMSAIKRENKDAARQNIESELDYHDSRKTRKTRPEKTNG
ncbi:hypothetical protein [Ensifer canadensis]